MVGQQVDEGALEQAEFDVKGVDCELARATVRQVLTDFDAVRDVRFSGNGAVVTYNPFNITTEEISTAIRQCGYGALLDKTHRSPLTGATRVRIRQKRKTKLGIL